MQGPEGPVGPKGETGTQGPAGDNTAALEAAQTANAAAAFAMEAAAEARAVAGTKADKTALVRTDRSLDALWKLNQGISYQFEVDDAAAYIKTVPSGAKLASVQKIGGRTICWNQLVDSNTVSITPALGRKIVSCIGGIWSFSISDGSGIAVIGGKDGAYDGYVVGVRVGWKSPHGDADRFLDQPRSQEGLHVHI